MATLSGFFGVLAALLATIGLYGVMSYMVARRRNEIGIRMALGADRREVVGMVMREAGTLLGAGLSVGLVLSVAAARAASTLLFGLSPGDPVTLALAAAVLAAVATVRPRAGAARRGWSPPRRYGKTEPRRGLQSPGTHGRDADPADRLRRARAGFGLGHTLEAGRHLERAIRIARELRSGDGRSLLRPQLSRVRRLAALRQPMRRRRAGRSRFGRLSRGDGVEADPYFDADGRSLYFISTRRPTASAARTSTSGAWDRDEKGQLGPSGAAPEPINATDQERLPRLSPDGWLYFGSKRPAGSAAPTSGGRARRATEVDGREPRPVGEHRRRRIRGAPVPDGARLIVMADAGLFETRRTASGWSVGDELHLPRSTRTGPRSGRSSRRAGRRCFRARHEGPELGEFFVGRRARRSVASRGCRGAPLEHSASFL